MSERHCKAVGDEKVRVNAPVFWGTSCIIILFSLVLVIFPDTSHQWLEMARNWMTAVFGWYYMLLMIVSLVFTGWLACSRYGHIVLGEAGRPPQFDFLTWSTMLFSSGIGIALVYYGAYEPLDHFLQPPQGRGGTPAAARQAMAITFLHWGIHGWALYGLLGTTFAYFSYCRGLPLTLRSALLPVFGRRVHGWAGNLVDGVGILVTVISMVTNLGIGALLVSAGLRYLFHFPQTPQMLLLLIGGMMLMATLVMVAGVEKGIARLSNINVIFIIILLAFVFLTGPTLNLMNGMLQNTGDYLTSLVGKSFDMYLYGHARQWQGGWTVFYWAWWVAWAPFVGLFIARISKGRTVRELILGVMLLPLGFTLTWLSVFGNTAIGLVIEHADTILGQVALSDPPMSIYKFFEYLPFTRFTVGFTIVVSIILFLTPVDSGTLMIARLSSQGGGNDEDAPQWLRIFWSAVTTLVCAGLLCIGNFDAMQAAVVLCGLPFSIVIVLYMVSVYRDMRLFSPPAALATTTEALSGETECSMCMREKKINGGAQMIKPVSDGSDPIHHIQR